MRIRALKPGFFKNEELCEMSAMHRLAFAGLWCCADREGRLEDRPKRLKAEIFPYDDVDMPAMLADLAASRFIVRYVVDGQALIWIPTWDEHQHPRQDEGKSALPAFTGEIDEIRPEDATDTDPQLTRHGPDADKRMGSGRWEVGDGKWEVGSADARVADATPAPRALMALWNATTAAPLPQCLELTSERARKAKSRLAKRPQLDDWRAIFERIGRSAFCRGDTGGGKGQAAWVASFDWVIANDTNAVKVLEGRYDNRGSPAPFVGGQAHGECPHEPRCGSTAEWRGGRTNCENRTAIEASRARKAAERGHPQAAAG